MDRILVDVEPENDPTGDVARTIGYRAVEAIYNGVDSGEWEEFMRYFASTTAELNRLTFKDEDSQIADVQRNIIYLAAYSVCGSITLTKLREVMDPVIDTGL
jgi:hypothetical protein